jgi:hypothetical protein
MEHMRQVAHDTVLRACSFASLGIFCVMTGMAFDPKLAFQAGGFLTTIMAFVLILKAREALTKDYRRTEMWLYIDKDRRPPESYAQWASSTILRDTYLNFAKWTALISITMWTLALAFSLFGAKSTYAFDKPSDTRHSNSFIAQTSDYVKAERADRRVPSIRYQVFP